MLANKNNLRSALTSNVSTTATSISITSWEWILRDTNTVACLEHYEDNVCTKREIIKITAKSTDTFTVTRWFAVCVMNDSTKAQWNTKQSFSTWDFLSLYLSKELRESITSWIPTNQTAITAVQNRITTVKNCIDGCCCNWIAKVQCLNNSHYCNWWFGDWSDLDLTVEWDEFLCADRVYNFRNLYICSWGCLRFEWQWVPQIKVYDHYVNDWVIDTRAWYVKTCSCTKKMIFWQTNTACNKNCNTYICPWTWWAYWQGWTQCDMTNGCNAVSDSCWGAGWRWSRNASELWSEWSPADWCNGWNGWAWAITCSCYSSLWGAGWGWGWGTWRFGNWWNWWDWGIWNVTYSWYNNAWWWWGTGWNSWLRGCWWKGWNWWRQWWANWWNGGCWYIWWNGWDWGTWSTNIWYAWWNGWNGGCWIYKWWDGWYMWYWYCYSVQNGWNGWNAITNIYWFILNARCVSWTWCIRACGWFGWDWGSTTCTWWWKYWGNGWNGWNWANWWQVIYAYMHGEPEQICVNWWAGWKWGCGWVNCKCKQISNWTDGCAWTDWWKVVYKVANL